MRKGGSKVLMVLAMCKEPMSACELSDITGFSIQRVAGYIRSLKSRGLIRKVGNGYVLTQRGIREVLPIMGPEIRKRLKDQGVPLTVRIKRTKIVSVKNVKKLADLVSLIPYSEIDEVVEQRILRWVEEILKDPVLASRLKRCLNCVRNQKDILKSSLKETLYTRLNELKELSKEYGEILNGKIGTEYRYVSI